MDDPGESIAVPQGRASAGLRNRVILVTGGARGIGAAVAAQAARDGGRIAIAYRSNHAAASALVEQIRSEGGVAEAIPGDLGTPDVAHMVVAEAERRLGPIDGLVASAAVMATGDFLETDEAAWEHMIRNDLYSVVFSCQAVLPGMVERGRGSIVTFASRLAATGSADAAAYAAAKAAVVALTRSLAAAYGPGGVRVNAVSPGTTGTDMGRAVIESPEGRARAARIPIRRFVEPQEVAAAVVFLLSDASSGIVGQTIQVNGGEFMG